MIASLLNGYRALDLTDHKGLVCGQILAALGVEVIKVEKPGGDPARNLPPFRNNISGLEESLYWLAFNTGKKSITLNLEKAQGKDLFGELAKRSDFILESFSPGYMDKIGLGFQELSRLNSRIIMTSITHFGQKGPHSQYKGSELVDSAMSGVLDNTGYLDRPPVKEALDSVYFFAGAAAVLGTLMAHYYRETGGEGQHIDISIQEAAAFRTTLCQLPWVWDRRLIKRGGPMGQIGFHPFRWVWPCKDGYIFWFFLGGQVGAAANRALSKWMDDEAMNNPLAAVTDWDKLDMAAVKQETFDAFQLAIEEFFLRRTKKEIAEEGLKRGINAVIVSDPSDVMENPQLLARNFWVDIDTYGQGTRLAYPGHYFLCSQTENYVHGKAPVAGQNNDEIYMRYLGISGEELNAFKEANII